MDEFFPSSVAFSMGPSSSSKGEASLNLSSRPRILLAASGSVAALKFATLAQGLSEWAEVRAICTKSALHFIDRTAMPASVKVYTDEDEWSSWTKVGDSVLHIELRKWADLLVIAPLSANSLAKVGR